MNTTGSMCVRHQSFSMFQCLKQHQDLLSAHILQDGVEDNSAHGADLDLEKVEIDKNFFKLHCYKAEAVSTHSQTPKSDLNTSSVTTYTEM